MGRPRTLTPSTSPGHFFGSEVRRARTAAGLTLAEFGAHVPCDSSTVSRIETGLLSPDSRFAAVCDELFPKADGWFSRFYAESREWGAYPPAFRSFAADEALATTISVFEPALVPGPLQIGDYARAILAAHPDVTGEQVEDRVQARLARQQVLDREAPPMTMFLVDGAVLRRQVGTSAVMYAQLTHIAEMSLRPNISVQLLQTDVHVGLQGAFTLAEISGGPDRVFIEDVTDGRVVEDPAVVSAVAMRFRHLQTEAMTATASRQLIERMAQELWKIA
jgi:transcriptional regulator with XRE-family HTH domain